MAGFTRTTPQQYEDYVEVAIKEVKVRTEKAFLIVSNKGREIWCPKSWCTIITLNKVRMPMWLLQQHAK